ncbi:MAG: Ig-like domain-containing protein [Clostridia bacterium]|nr:Ig-like domain-containing protein [Clostridia bacterium]
MKKIFLLLASLVFMLCGFCFVSCQSADIEVNITQNSMKIDLLSSKILTAEVTPNDTELQVVWSSSDENVVSINQNGKIVGMSLGTATITATVGEATDTCQITVKLPTDNKPQILLKSGIYENTVMRVGDQATIDNVIFYKNTEHTDASWAYTVTDTSVVEINDGKIIAKAVGQTQITIKPSWKGIESDDFNKTVTVTVKQFDKENILTYTDTEYFNQYGRTYTSNEGLFLDMSGTAIEFDFYGTELKIDAVITKGEAVAVRVFIDNDDKGNFIKLTNSSNSDVVLAENLSNTAHTARIVKASPQDIGVIAIKNVKASSFAKATAKSDLLIEFIGDSITVGYSILDGGHGSQTVNNTDASKTYAYSIAKNLNADFSFVATQGIAVNSTPYLSTTMVNLYRWYSANKKVNYIYEKSPDVVVINLGTNDAAYLAQNPSHNLANDYFTLLNLIRGYHTDAYIVLTYGMMSIDEDVKIAINSAIDDFGDEKISFVTPAEPSGEGGHPNQAVNDKTAEILTEYIKNLLAE